MGLQVPLGPLTSLSFKRSSKQTEQLLEVIQSMCQESGACVWSWLAKDCLSIVDTCVPSMHASILIDANVNATIIIWRQGLCSPAHDLCQVNYSTHASRSLQGSSTHALAACVGLMTDIDLLHLAMEGAQSCALQTRSSFTSHHVCIEAGWHGQADVHGTSRCLGLQPMLTAHNIIGDQQSLRLISEFAYR